MLDRTFVVCFFFRKGGGWGDFGSSGGGTVNYGGCAAVISQSKTGPWICVVMIAGGGERSWEYAWAEYG